MSEARTKLDSLDTEEHTQTILQDVTTERQRQERLWGEERHEPIRWIAIIAEELGAAAAAALTQSEGAYRRELVDVAAVAVAAIESYDASLCAPSCSKKSMREKQDEVRE